MNKERVLLALEQLGPLMVLMDMDIKQAKSLGLTSPTILLISDSTNDNALTAMGAASGFLKVVEPSCQVVRSGMDLSHEEAGILRYDWKMEFTLIETDHSDLVDVRCMRADHIVGLLGSKGFEGKYLN